MRHPRRHRCGIAGITALTCAAVLFPVAPPALAAGPAGLGHAGPAGHVEPAGDRAAHAPAPEPWSPAPVAPVERAGQREAAKTLGDTTEVDDNPVPETTGQLLPVLPLGAGLTSLGLGLAFLGLRLRRA